MTNTETVYTILLNLDAALILALILAVAARMVYVAAGSIREALLCRHLRGVSPTRRYARRLGRGVSPTRRYARRLARRY